MKNSITLAVLCVGLFAIGCQQASDQPATASNTPAAPATTPATTPAPTPDATAANAPATPVSAPATGYPAVQAILTTSCMPCHSAAGHKGDLDVTSYDSVAKAVVPGNPDASKLVRMISGDKPKMPKNAPALSADKVKTISDWVKAGAKNG